MNWVQLQLYLGFASLLVFFYVVNILRVKADIGGRKMVFGMVIFPILGIFFLASFTIFPGLQDSFLFGAIDRINRYHITTYLFGVFFYGVDIYRDKYKNGADKSLGKLHSFIEEFVILFFSFILGYTTAFFMSENGVNPLADWGVDIQGFILAISFLVGFWINGAIFMKREPYKVVRFMFVLTLESFLVLLSLASKGKIMMPFCDFFVSMTITWAVIDLTKLRRFNPGELNGEEPFVAKVNRYYSRRTAFFGITLCIDSQSAETTEDYTKALSLYEGDLRNMGTIVSETDNFLYKNTNNCITALIPVRNKEKDLKKIMDITARWNYNHYVMENIKSRILVTMCPEDVSLANVYINFLKLFSKRELNREMEVNTTYFCDETMKSRYMAYIAVEKALEQLCLDQNFEVYYQPIYSTEEGYCSCVEALARFPKLDEGFFERLERNYGEDVCRLVREESFPDPKNSGYRILKASAEDFIRMAESKKLIYKVGKIIYKKACDFFVKNELNSRYGIHYIEINLSLRQCEETALANEFMTIAYEAGLPSGFINFEITEGIARTKSVIVNDNLKKLQEAHFSFSMDDFGTGYSNLIGIVDDKYSVIKIDKSILDNCFEEKEPYRRHKAVSPQEREQTVKLLKAVIKMIRGQEKKIVFEGVCDKERKEALDSFGGGYYQGFYFSQPLIGDRYLEFLKTIGGKCDTADNSKIDGAEFKNE